MLNYLIPVPITNGRNRVKIFLEFKSVNAGSFATIKMRYLFNMHCMVSGKIIVKPF